MQICKSHWWLMKESVHARGLWPLVAVDGHQVVERMKSEIEGTADDSTYDPLMASMHMINAQALKMGGLYLMDDKGMYCPLCEVNKYLGMGTDIEWVNGCMDSVLEYCREHRIVPPNAQDRIATIRLALDEPTPAETKAETKARILILLNDLAEFIKQDESTRFALHNQPKE